MITQRFGLMKYIPVFHPFGVALRSKSVPDGFVTKDFTMMYCRVGFAHRDRNGGQSPPYLLCGFNLDSVVEHRFSVAPQASGQGAACS